MIRIKKNKQPPSKLFMEGRQKRTGSSVKRDTLIWVLPSENDCKAYSVGQKLKPFQGRLSRLKLVPKRTAHCISYTRNSQDYQSGEKNFSFNRNIYAHKDVKEALIQSQYGKCCFCEQIIYGDGDVEHFRPKQAYRQEKGNPLQRPGYYWLTYEWDNLYLACTACNQRHKENLFPLINTQDRATSHHDDVKKEKPIFIDPGKEDPENFIGFRGEFAVGFEEEGRGQTTIQALGLNRTSLRESRKDKLKLLQSLSQILKSIDQNSQSIELMEELDQAKILLEQSMSSKGEFSAAVKCSINNNFEFIL